MWSKVRFQLDDKDHSKYIQVTQSEHFTDLPNVHRLVVVIETDSFCMLVYKVSTSYEMIMLFLSKCSILFTSLEKDQFVVSR